RSRLRWCPTFWFYPSPLEGEGGEGCAATRAGRGDKLHESSQLTPHPRTLLRRLRCPLPQGERAKPNPTALIDTTADCPRSPRIMSPCPHSPRAPLPSSSSMSSRGSPTSAPPNSPSP